jgi:rod shape-determining protein MreC
MKNLIAFLVKYFHWMLFVVLEVVSVVLLFRYNSYQGSVWFSSASYVAGHVYEADAAVRSYFSLASLNKQLLQRNYHLERQVTQLRRLYGELTSDTTELERQEQAFLSRYELIEAQVISNTVHRADNLITIDRGAADGVQRDMGVVCGSGIVGVVYMVSSHYAVVIPVLNTTSSHISCSIRGRGYFGYLHWDGGDPTVAFLEDVPRHARFKRGDWVESSGYSAIFPPGVLVGRIETIYNSLDGLSYRLKVRLTTDFSCLRDVYVINDKSFAERLRLMEQVQDSLTMKPEN